jgi:hypothetical protein
MIEVGYVDHEVADATAMHNLGSSESIRSCTTLWASSSLRAMAPPSANHRAVIAHSYPSAPCVCAVRVQRQVEGSLGADGVVGGTVLADQGFVVTQPKLAAPLVTAFCNRERSFRVEL